ncbi:hypothetical protein [Mesorhizobium sp. M0217]|uniref:hypothetical protein n=1 Tax=unclassified Mesorhizobium TaxID=325217 RepID=UPI00333CEF53
MEVAESLAAVVHKWTAGSRVSPIWLIKGFDGASTSFSGKQFLLFLGPVQPAALLASIEGLATAGHVGIWLTAGCFNVVLRIADSRPGKSLVRSLLKWAADEKIPHEQWTLSDCIITKTAHRAYAEGSGHNVIDKLAKSVAQTTSPVLHSAFEENVVATATSLMRAATAYPLIFSKMHAIAEAACAQVEAYNDDKIGVLDMQSRLLSMNAALSRFSSQAFSGISPILATECHFWIHSLLGTGSANIALANLVDSIQQVLGEARLPERLGLLEGKTSDVPSKIELVTDSSLLDFDIMSMTGHDVISSSPIVPLVTYFSGRDGFSSRLATLSAPLATLAECNSFRSNLLTVTHEISHIFVQSALSFLGPSLNEEDMNLARTVAKPHFQAANHLEAARQLLVEAVIAMELARTDLQSDQVDNKLPELFERWRDEMQEILVHAFDFLYFHQGDPTFYVTSIWHSWCAIPGISNRVPEYLMRTLCTVAATLLTGSSKGLFQAALASTKALLSDITPNIDPSSNYVEQALRLIDRIDRDQSNFKQMEKDFFARLYLVRLVKIYLFSELLAARLFSDPYARPSGTGDEKRKLSYNTAPLGNALIFLKDQLKENPSEAESLWVLHCLAFDLRRVPGFVK